MFKIASFIHISRANNFFMLFFLTFSFASSRDWHFFMLFFFNFPICFIPRLAVSRGSLQTLTPLVGHCKRHFWSCKVEVGFEFMCEKCFWVTSCASCVRRFHEKFFRFVMCVISFFEKFFWVTS